MGYRTILESTPETVQDLEISAQRRLDEAVDLYVTEKHHTAIYIAGLSAEMYLKTACYFLGGAKPADLSGSHLAPLMSKKYKPPFLADRESGHGLWFWSQELMHRRRNLHLSRTPKRFLQVIASIYMDWFVEMRYRPGSANGDDAARFITQVEWLANNHSRLRR
jgi:hypothetical protein